MELVCGKSAITTAVQMVKATLFVCYNTQVPENTAAGALVAHLTVSDLDSGSQGHVECRLETDDHVTGSSFSLHRDQPNLEHFRSVVLLSV